MKKLILLITGLTLCVTTGVFAQGTVTFANSAATLAQTNAGPATPTAAAAVGTAVFQLLYLPQVGTNPPTGAQIVGGVFNLNGMEAIAGSSGMFTAGRFNGGTKTTGVDVTGGTPAWFQVIGWSAQFTDLPSAIAGGGFVGVSGVWSNPTGNPNGTPPTSAQAFIFGAAGFNGIILSPVPEPGTIALGGLGVAALLLFRRRK